MNSSKQRRLISFFIDMPDWKFTPYQVLVLSFAGLIALGTLLLMTPQALAGGNSISIVDALFTATSAVCITGLSVVDTGTQFSLFGQTVIIFLVQVGGLGLMTMTTLMALLIGKKIRLRERVIIQQALNQLSMSGLVKLTLYIVKITLLIEFVGGTILALRLYHDYGIMGIYMGYWHAISAFCNAGFDLFGNFTSLTRYVGDFIVNMTVGVLILLGGVGFTVISDVWESRQFSRCSLHTKIVLVTTAILTVIGTLGVFMLEFTNENTLGGLAWFDKIMASLFQSLTVRSAGYATIDIEQLHEATWLYFCVLMFIGASPASTGGGIKTTTFAVIVMAVSAFIQGKADVEIFQRKIPYVVIYKSFAIFSIAVGLVVSFCIILSLTEEAPFILILFEVVSALGTTGLSTGLTPELTNTGKISIMIAMFAGRVGPMTLVLALALKKQKSSPVQYPEGKIIIG
ncbi:TrkH family potassium uptake protein [Acetonema longum]|nr:TrkH family potassium uptake protein [Acetonema longum]